jgi:TetR/AcrR family transcriptional regulator, transcriptional repressor for nem operon
MARTIKQAEYDARRSQILDAALRLVQTVGYEQMSIQNILDTLNISKGAFYHYFDSKQALLEALVDRMGQQGAQVLLPIVADPNLTAIEKLRRYFETSAQYKNMQKELILSLLRTWYTDDNAIVRHKLVAAAYQFTGRQVLEPIIRQGIGEGAFTTRYPAQTARIIVGIALTVSEALTGLLLSPRVDEGAVRELEIGLDAYLESVERILGAPQGSLSISAKDTFKDWLDFSQPETTPEANPGA